jgi:hypothetical protein
MDRAHGVVNAAAPDEGAVHAQEREKASVLCVPGLAGMPRAADVAVTASAAAGSALPGGRGMRAHLQCRARAALALSTAALGGLAAATLGALASGCGEKSAAADLKIERLPDVAPSLPSVPTLPPPPHPITYPDQTYSVYGVRKRMHQTEGTDVTVTAYIVAVYQPPACEPNRVCPPARIPHIFVADTPNESDRNKQLIVVGYAENMQQVSEARAAYLRGRPLTREEGDDRPPIPGDLAVGAKIKVRGRFTRVTGTGFAQSDGVLEYAGHETLEPAPELAEAFNRLRSATPPRRR